MCHAPPGLYSASVRGSCHSVRSSHHYSSAWNIYMYVLLDMTWERNTCLDFKEFLNCAYSSLSILSFVIAVADFPMLEI